MTTNVKLTDWETVTAELQQFGAGGEVSTDGDSIRVEFSNAYIEVTKEGTISTGMPLHDLEHEGDGSLMIDHENNEISIQTDEFDYTFRCP
jgi:hypothetical protein